MSELFVPCLFCGGNAHEPRHWQHCDGRQGHVEAEELPLLASGLTTDTYQTSITAAVSVEAERGAQRSMVFAAIKRAGTHGMTDDELQVALGLDGSSERPRRWELWKLDAISPLRDDQGKVVRRLTRTRRSAVVWVEGQSDGETTELRYAAR